MINRDKRPKGKRSTQGIARALPALLSLLAFILFGCTDSDTGMAYSTQPSSIGSEAVDSIPPDYYISFDEEAEVYRCVGNSSVVLSPSDGTLKVSFVSGNGETAEDPYFTLPLSYADINPREYGYIALRVKTSKATSSGQLRFGTATDDRLWSCCELSYSVTEEWQTVTADVSSALFMDENGVITLDGDYTQLRIDPFDNAGSDDEFYIQSYAFFKSLGEAENFKGIESKIYNSEVKNNMSNKGKWLGEAFSSPPAKYRASKLLYGFSDNYKNMIDKLQSFGYGGVVSNVNFNEQYLKDPAEFVLLSEAYGYAAEKGMYTWIYDEYQWPSGKAFGQVLEGHNEYEAVGACHLSINGWDGKTSYVLPEGYEKIVYAQFVYSDGRKTAAIFDKKLSNKAISEKKSYYMCTRRKRHPRSKRILPISARCAMSTS